MYVESAVVVVVLFPRRGRPANPGALRRADCARALPYVVAQLPDCSAACTAPEAKDALEKLHVSRSRPAYRAVLGLRFLQSSMLGRAGYVCTFH